MAGGEFRRPAGFGGPAFGPATRAVVGDLHVEGLRQRVAPVARPLGRRADTGVCARTWRSTGTSCSTTEPTSSRSFIGRPRLSGMLDQASRRSTGTAGAAAALRGLRQAPRRLRRTRAEVDGKTAYRTSKVAAQVRLKLSAGSERPRGHPSTTARGSRGARPRTAPPRGAISPPRATRRAPARDTAQSSRRLPRAASCFLGERTARGARRGWYDVIDRSLFYRHLGGWFLIERLGRLVIEAFRTPMVCGLGKDDGHGARQARRRVDEQSFSTHTRADLPVGVGFGVADGTVQVHHDQELETPPRRQYSLYSTRSSE